MLSHRIEARCSWFLVALVAIQISASAATKTWTGAGTTDNWSTSANWSPAGAPVNGDTLIFPQGANRAVNSNNLADLRLNSISITGSGYTLTGNGVTVTNNVLITYPSGLVSVALDFTLCANQNFDNRGPLTSFSGDINLNGFNFIAHARDAGEIFILAGAITGTGNVTYSGAGNLVVQGAQPNTYTGVTTVSGHVRLAKTAGIAAVPDDLIVHDDGEVVWFSDDQVPNLASVTVLGSLNLNGQSETLGPLDLESAAITTGAGELTLNGPVTSRESPLASIISGHLDLGPLTRAFVVEDGPVEADLIVSASIAGGAVGVPGNYSYAGLIKQGDGLLSLSGDNTFSGTTQVQGGKLRAFNDTALGTATGGTFVAENASLLLGNLAVINEPLTLNGPGDGISGALHQLTGATTNSANITLAGPTLITVASGGSLGLSGVISGPGDLTTGGQGELRLLGGAGNTYDGQTWVKEGEVLLWKTGGRAIPGDVLVGVTPANFTTAKLRNIRDEQIGGDVTVRWTGTWDLDGHDESSGHLALEGAATVDTTSPATGFGTLRLSGGITATPGPSFAPTATILGQLEVGPFENVITVGEGGASLVDEDPPDLVFNAIISGVGAITKRGAGDLYLAYSNIFAGPVNVEEGELRVGHDHALGATTAGTRVSGDAVLALVEWPIGVVTGGVRITNEVLELDSAGQPGRGAFFSSDRLANWNGPVILHRTTEVRTTTNELFASWANLQIDGSVSGPGGIVKTGPGGLMFLNSGANTYGGVTTVNEGRLQVARLAAGAGIPGDLIVGDGNGQPDSAVVELGLDLGINYLQLQPDAAVNLNSDGLLRVQMHSPSSVGTLAGNGRVEISALDQFYVGEGDTSSTFDGGISGAGELTKVGTGTVILNGNNTLTGDTGVSSGKLVINGTHTASKVVLSGTGQLGGTGHLGDLTALSSTSVFPGASPGLLSASAVSLRPSSFLEMELDGPVPGADYDQVAVGGALSVSNAFLLLRLNHLPAEGNVFTLLNKSSPGPVLGKFGNVPDETPFNLSGFEVVLSHAGGDGNDVTLTVITNRHVDFQSATVTLGNGNGYIDPNECNHLTISVRNISAGPLMIGGLRLDSDTPGLIITHQEWPVNAVVAPNALFTNAQPIQFRTLPGFKCGVPANFSLTLSATANGTPVGKLRVPFSIAVPGPNSFFAYGPSSGLPLPIPDNGSAVSTINVPGNVSQLSVQRAQVAVHVTHPRAADLRLRLVTPAGQDILLTANHGGTGANYGNNCTGGGTIFSDLASVAIGAGGAPFAGFFRPDEPLAAAQGQSLTGAWQLVIEDTAAGNVGTLECWSLGLVPNFCQDQGGGCEPCVGTMAGSLGAAELSRRLLLSAEAAGVCGWAKPFPGLHSSPGSFRYATHTFTNNGPDNCISVLLKNTCATPASALMVSVYTNFFDPADLQTNYVADSALTNALTGQFSFRAAANQVFVVVVNDTLPTATSTCEDYHLEVFGLPCPPPELDISSAVGPDEVKLLWSTGYPAHQLERASALTSPATFEPAPGLSKVISGKYTVTNQTTGAESFYRLRRP